MMKKLLFFLIMLILFSSFAHSGNTVRFRVACTIPAIPGVNVPALEQEEARPQETEKEEETFITQTEEKENEENVRIIIRTMVAK
jgi:hypothetical protein